MEKILVSACLLGDKCTYKATDNEQSYMAELNRYFDLVPFCPEVEGGLGVPRKPAERRGSSVYDESGRDVTAQYTEGAMKAAQICSFLCIRFAILKENSPACGVHRIHNGYFKNTLIEGEGVTAALLRHNGVTIMNEEEGLAFLEEHKRQMQIKAERGRIAEARRNAESEQPKPERSEKPKGKPYQHGPAVRGYQGKPTGKPHNSKGGRKPFGKKKPFDKKKPTRE